jgi:SAM-dependent methyltransferase
MDENAYREMAALQATHWWYRGRREIIAHMIGMLGLPPRARILEAGCGPGGNLAMLARFGEVSAFEPYDATRAHAIATGAANVVTGTLPDGIPFEGPFDLVCGFDVIEHVEDHAAAVRALGNRLGPDGRLLLTVPANPALWSEHDVRNHHFRRYTREALTGIVREAGLSVTHLSSFNSRLLPVVTTTRAVQKTLKLGAKAEEAMPPPPLNALLERIFAGEAPRVATRGYTDGVSLLLVAERAPVPQPAGELTA